MRIRYGNYAFQVRNLGPGIRSVLWVSGCSFSCPGCIGGFYHSAEETAHWEDAGKMADLFLKKGYDSEGITISGGEPTLQSDALAELIREIKRRKDWGVILYSGFYMNELKERQKTEPGLTELLSMTDLLIDGRYEREKDVGDALKGSSNQTAWFLTDRYIPFKGLYENNRKRKIEIRFEDDQVMMIGLPDEQEAQRWENIKRYLKKVTDPSVRERRPV